MTRAADWAPLEPLPLAITPATPDTDAPICTLCGRPRRWLHQRQGFARYCGGSSCTSVDRACQVCGTRFLLGVAGAGVKYCSAECKHEGYTRGQRVRHRRDAVRCNWCQEAEPRGRAYNPATYVCPTCRGPLTTVWQRMVQHHVPLELRRQLLTDPVCQICGVDVVTPVRTARGVVEPRLVVDHDHDCCPRGPSCGRCVRGLVCGPCNHMLGHAYNNPDTLERGATYLRGQVPW